MKQTKSEVIEFLKELASSHPKIMTLKLFGSRARGDADERSDYDVAVYSKTSSGTERFYLDASENAPTLCKIELVDMNSDLDNRFRARIEEEGIPFYP